MAKEEKTKEEMADLIQAALSTGEIVELADNLTFSGFPLKPILKKAALQKDISKVIEGLKEIKVGMKKVVDVYLERDADAVSALTPIIMTELFKISFDEWDIRLANCIVQWENILDEN